MADTVQRFLAPALSSVAILLLAACPDSSISTPKGNCEKAYDKCTLPSGVLGVCDVVDCPAGQASPCLMCRSQH